MHKALKEVLRTVNLLDNIKTDGGSEDGGEGKRGRSLCTSGLALSHSVRSKPWRAYLPTWSGR